jgi:hypothetical protein
MTSREQAVMIQETFDDENESDKGELREDINY